MGKQMRTQSSNIQSLQSLSSQLQQQLAQTPKFPIKKEYKDCSEYRLDGYKDTGLYNITLSHALSHNTVWCDMTTDNGGWTLIQRRQDGSVYFYRDWAEYKNGFGNIDGEFWLGNDNIHYLTNQKDYRLRVDLWDFEGNHRHAEYDDFKVDDEKAKYLLHFGKYNGTAGDSLKDNNNMKFSTKYQDNDNWSGNCVQDRKGAFWMNQCQAFNPNGIYHFDPKYNAHDAIWWYSWKGTYALKKVEMKVRPMLFHRF
ncbi:fibrinogen-like protein 1 [Lingula anatina]|uniref:Fibrinogen-like protein 1 n=1 Tax=Lingula anatina TaxID=7574 RepID=A0A1S3HTA9_LINAN|nr:fibrinogen-like protein 1 [Lingula anatina]|eukprot:XP_013388294.1 fibrinogen-like protein 1 [Lingula anatina]